MTLTRRELLRDIFKMSIENDSTVQDLLDEIEEFHAGGQSGLEAFVRGFHTKLSSTYTAVDNPCAELIAELESAKAAVADAQAALDAVYPVYS